MGPTNTKEESIGTNIMFNICSGLTFSPNSIGTAMSSEKNAEQLNPNQSDPKIAVNL